MIKCIKRLISIVIICIVMILIFKFYQYLFFVFRDCEKYYKNHIVVEQDSRDEFDILLFGSSHMGDIQPIDFWSQFGYTAYNLYNRGDGIKKTYARLALALDYLNPKIVVVDVDSWVESDNYEEDAGNFHRAFDCFPLSVHKYKLVKEVVDDAEAQKKLLFPFLMYHRRWYKLEEKDWETNGEVYLGGAVHSVVDVQETPKTFNVNVDIDKYDSTEEAAYVRKIIELCQSKNIKLLLTCLPYPAITEERAEQYEYIKYVADDYGVPYYNFFDDTPVVNYASDYRDQGHFNLSGSRKLVAVLGEQIKEIAAVEDKRNQDGFDKRWNERYSKYYQQIVADCIEKKDDTSEENDDIPYTRDSMLILMSLDEFVGEIYLKNSEFHMLEDERLVSLLENVTEQQLTKLDYAKESGEDYLLVLNSDGESIQEYVGDEVRAIIGDNEDNIIITVRSRVAGTEELDYRE